MLNVISGVGPIVLCSYTITERYIDRPYGSQSVFKLSYLNQNSGNGYGKLMILLVQV